jgi:hypothetical protein
MIAGSFEGQIALYHRKFLRSQHQGQSFIVQSRGALTETVQVGVLGLRRELAPAALKLLMERD